MKERTVKEGLGTEFVKLFCFIVLFFACTTSFTVYADNVFVTTHVPLTTEYKQVIADNSLVIASPTSLLINQTSIITVTIRGNNDEILANHTVQIGVIGVNGVKLTQLTTVTDAYGNVTAELNSSVPGQFEVYAIDMTYKESDNAEILLSHTATVVFTSNQITNIITHIVSTPTQTPTPSPSPISTVIPTLTPTLITIPQTTGVIDENGNVFQFGVCDSFVLFLLTMIIFLIPYIWILKKHIEKQKKIQEFGVYSIILIILAFLLEAYCFPLIIVASIWIVVLGILKKVFPASSTSSGEGIPQ